MSLRTRTLLLVTGLMVVTVLVTSAVLSYLSHRILLDETQEDAILIASLLARSAHFAGDARVAAEQSVGEQMVVEATILAHLVAIAEARGMSPDEINARLRAIARDSRLDEIWITDERGHAYLRTAPDVDFTFSPDPRLQPQASEFWPLLTGERAQVVQEARRREIDARVFKYVGVGGVDKPRIVQVGFDVHFLDTLRDQLGLPRLVQELLWGGQIAAIGVYDDELVTLAYSALPGWEASAPLTAADVGDMRAALAEGRTASRLGESALTVVTPIVDEANGRVAGVALVQLPTDHIQAAMRDELLLTGLVVALVLLVGSLGAILLARDVTRPVVRLTGAVEAIEANAFTPALLAPVVSRKDELGQLGRVLGDYARLRDDQVRQAVVSHELARAWEIQSKLLPADPQGWPGALDLAVRFRPARETSGDFYDVMPLPAPPGPNAADASSPAFAPLQIAVADVAGKGIAAALVMALARAMLRTIAELTTQPLAHGAPRPARVGPPARNGEVPPPDERAPSPAATLSGASRRLHQDVGRRDFVCCALAVVEPPAAGAAGPRLRLANAGQVPPILCRGSEARELEPPGERFPLGVLPEADYAELVLDLVPGDVVIFASDGLPEAPAQPSAVGGDQQSASNSPPATTSDPAAPAIPGPPQPHSVLSTQYSVLPPASAPGELFGFERLAASAAAWTARGASADAIAAGIWADVTDWCGEASQHDDMTLLVLRVPPTDPI
jgi:serine phosphatase RsbU (regulator of sigma subunit)